jgi:hypothetical protein
LERQIISNYYYYYYYYYYYRYSALGSVRAETRAQSGDWYGSGTLHPGQILRGSLPLLSPVSQIYKRKKITISYLNLYIFGKNAGRHEILNGMIASII